jgi:two-component system chemotaxis sensor kinase CheA
MDVVSKNIERIGGNIQVDSTPGKGTVISIRIPLTLAIIDGMTIKAGSSRYTIPTTAIRESFRAKPGDVITDTQGQEIIIIRGVCYPVLRLYEVYKIKQAVTDIYQGITIMVENNGKGFCIFADELLGQQQVVVKALPSYIKKVRGLAGCTLLGDGNISLILDVDGFMNAYL